MDRLTDFLTVFFVNNSVKEKYTNRVKKNKKDNDEKSKTVSISSHQGTSSNNIPLKIEQKTESVKKESVKKESVKKESVKKESVKKESFKKESDKDNTFTSSEKENSELFTKSSSSSKNSNNISTEFTNDKSKESTNNKSKESTNNKSKESTNDKSKESINDKSKESTNNHMENSLSSLSFSSYNGKKMKSESIKSEKEYKFDLKKYILKPSEFYKKNILVANDDKKNNFDITSDLLYKLSLLKDIGNIYSKDIYIFTQNDNRKMFKQMLLDNPYLYFTDFHVKQNIDKNILKDDKRVICVIDTDILKNIDDLQDFLNPQIHLILLTLETNKVIDYYNTLMSSTVNKRLLIHKQNKLKSLQKRFFKYVISNINKNIDFNDYYNKINDENIDLKYIILKDDEIRYN